MTTVTHKDIHHLQRQIEDLKLAQEKNYKEQKETNEKNHDELKQGLIRASDKLDLALLSFQTREDARRESDRIEKEFDEIKNRQDTLTGRLWGLAGGLLLSVAGGIISFFFRN